MTQLFLTSSVHAVAHDIAKRVSLSSGNKLAFINTASEPKEESSDLEWLRNDRRSLVKAGFDVTDYTITGKNRGKLEDDLKDFDFIYMSGGNTTYLLEQSQKSGFISLVKELVNEKGKVYIGTSAGSIIAGPRLPDYFDDGDYDVENTDGYGFVNFTLIPHWGSGHFKERYLSKRLEIVYTEEQNPLLLLTDTQYVYVSDGKVEIIDVKSGSDIVHPVK